jgi:CheY-like chemotaxis protein
MLSWLFIPSSISDRPGTMALHDSREISMRARRLITAALIISLLNGGLSYLQGYLISTFITGLLCFYFTFIIWLYKRNYTRHAKALAIVGFNLFLLIINFSEGLKSGSFLYFAILIFGIPFLIDKNKKYNKEVIFYFLISMLSFAACIFLCPQKSTWQNISEADYDVMFKANSLSTITLSAVFAYFSIYFERQYAQALIEQKEKVENAMKARSQFLSHMGHELRTPLNGIIGATNLLSNKIILKEQEEEFNILKYCSTHMLDLINNILDYNKIEAGKLEIHPTKINLKQVLQNSVLPFFNRFDGKQVKLITEIDECLNEVVLADDIRLIQILNNLLSNALKFTETGSVKLKARTQRKTAEKIQVSFSVQDTGIGIKKEDHLKVFESFGQVYTESTRKYHGTGLGISICQRILQLMNSKLEMKSTYGEGTTFSFSISFDKANKEQEAQTGHEPVTLTGLKVLLAEDNIINMMIAQKMLQDWQVEMVGIENGILALKELEKNADFDLILLDLEMPEMDGYTAIKEIRKNYPNIPVLAFTAALVDNTMLEELKTLGFADAILKPFPPMELFTKMRKYKKRTDTSVCS